MNANAPKDRKYQLPEGSGKILFSALAQPTPISFLGTAYWGVKNALVTTFGQFPFELDTGHLPTLKAMAAASGEGHTPYTDLIAGLEKHGAISVNLEKSTPQIK